MFSLDVNGKRELVQGELMPNGIVRLRDVESGLTGLMRPDGTDFRGDLSYCAGWRRYFTVAVRRHFGYER